MKTSTLRVAMAQINTTVGDIEGNRAKILAFLANAESLGADICAFPEMTVTGYPPEDLLLKPHFITQNLKALASIAKSTRRTAALVGFIDRDPSGALYNAAAVCHNGRILYTYRKVELPNYGVFDEKRYFESGTRPGRFSFHGLSIGLTICEDIWLKRSFVYKKEYLRGVSILFNLSASPYHHGKQTLRKRLVCSLARFAERPVIYMNLVGGQDELVFDGRSLVVDPSGAVRAEAAGFCEDLKLVTFETVSKGKLSVTDADKVTAEQRNSPEEEVYKALVLGVRDYVEKNGFKKVLIGLSGGIDSALVACLAVDAIGNDNVIGVTMPSPYTSSGTLKDAKILAKNLGITCLQIPITPVFKSFLSALRGTFKGMSEDTTEENIQARIRGTLLMALSNKWGHLVLTTGNKSEIATGYCTLYGDMAGGFAVIKDVPKTLVFLLARLRNLMAGRALIPTSIIRRAPSAELRRNQKDQDSLPPYPLLDAFLSRFIESDMPVEKIAGKGLSAKTARHLARLIESNEYKRRQAPPGIKITPKAFGRDRRMPITNRFEK